MKTGEDKMDDIFDIIEEVIEGAGSDTDVKNPNKEQGVQDGLFCPHVYNHDNYEWVTAVENYIYNKNMPSTSTYAISNDAQILKAMNDCASIYEQIAESQENTYSFASVFHELQSDLRSLGRRVEALYDATRELTARVEELEVEVKQQ